DNWCFGFKSEPGAVFTAELLCFGNNGGIFAEIFGCPVIHQPVIGIPRGDISLCIIHIHQTVRYLSFFRKSGFKMRGNEYYIEYYETQQGHCFFTQKKAEDRQKNRE